MKQRAIICDLDGTLYDAKLRQDKHLRGPKKDFDAFHADAKNDPPHHWCAQLIKCMEHFGFRILFTSGRDERFRLDTEEWLKTHLNWGREKYKLIMRPEKDYTADDEMKKAWYRDLIEPGYEVLFCIDDRKRVVDMWRGLGLPCLQCDVGDF